VADPELEREGREGGFALLALQAFLPSLLSSLFTQIKGGGGSLDPLGSLLSSCVNQGYSQSGK